MNRITIESWLVENGRTMDKWGHYHKFKPTHDNILREARMKMQESSIRYEVALENDEWAIIVTDYYKDCCIKDNKLQINDLLVGR